MKTLCFAAASGLLFALAPALHAGGEGWLTDFEAAKAQAAKEDKDLLIDFTGSDWCGWCIKLKQEVFVHEAFKTGVEDKFVLVELDFPRDKTKLSQEVQEQNKKLGEMYAVRGYPTIMLTDAEGLPYAKTGYRRGGPEAYVKHLDELREIKAKRDEGLAAAAKAEGVEKAKALVTVIETVQLSDQQLATFYGDLIEQIKAADPNDESGYFKKREAKERFVGINKKINDFARQKDFEGGVGYLEGLLKDDDFEPLQKQQLLMVRAMMLMELDKGEEALKSIDSALAADPDGPMNERIKGYRTKLQKDLEAEAAKDKPKPAPADQ